MKRKNLVQKALKFAKKAHEGQTRKYTGEPYVVHPIAVASIVKKVGGSKEMITAALLHDVVEDCEVKMEELLDLFGKEVAGLVDALTDVSTPKDGIRKERKALDRQHIGEACGKAQTIKLADLIDNTSSITRHDANFARVYMSEKRMLLEVLTKGNDELLRQATEIVKEYYAK